MFKKNYDHLTKDTYFGMYKESTRGNPNYFLTYGNGKSAARIQDHLRPNGAHRWHNYMKTPKYNFLLYKANLLVIRSWFKNDICSSIPIFVILVAWKTTQLFTAYDCSLWLTVRSNWKKPLSYIIHIRSSPTWLPDGIGVVVSLQRMTWSDVLCWNLIDQWVSLHLLASVSVWDWVQGYNIRINFSATPIYGNLSRIYPCNTLRTTNY